ncbi:beta-alanine degradation protein BauB [Aliidongia dinghuensis]|uniref:Beta-alanine degradation protein BauB n=1 Tax=Aliidongia dinghuensis TaxID=1867774 RepID=A0A8J2YWG2_9PROT|nr:cupin domain-containing protein [Aliidongia dinghuensis]GGF32032.1 beta-alanine degradation protein BauB [Aliidongia dinghuensis]
MTSEAVAVGHVDNDDVRVTEWRFAPGAATGQHRHDYDYVVVPLTGGLLKAIAAAGETVAELVPGKAYFRKAGVEHNVVNAGSEPFAFVEIELKHRPG